MYTREQVLGMSAGRELDHLVATHVMEIENEWRHWFAGATRYYDFMDADLQIIPDYSTDIAAAWEVAEKMRETHVYELADFGRNTHKNSPHYAAFHPIDKPRDYERQVRSTSLSEAIAKAALLSLLKED